MSFYDCRDLRSGLESTVTGSVPSTSSVSSVQRGTKRYVTAPYQGEPKEHQHDDRPRIRATLENTFHEVMPLRKASDDPIA